MCCEPPLHTLALVLILAAASSPCCHVMSSRLRDTAAGTAALLPYVSRSSSSAGAGAASAAVGTPLTDCHQWRLSPGCCCVTVAVPLPAVAATATAAAWPLAVGRPMRPMRRWMDCSSSRLDDLVRSGQVVRGQTCFRLCKASQGQQMAGQHCSSCAAHTTCRPPVTPC